VPDTPERPADSFAGRLPVTRRRFLGAAAGVAAGVALEACQPAVPLRPAGPSATSSAPVAAASEAASGSPAGAPSSVPTRELVLHNARVITIDSSQPEATAVRIVGDTIAAVGDDDAVRGGAGSDALHVDVGGLVVLPGFNDAHCHRIGDREIAGHATPEEAIENALAGGWTSISEMFVNQERLDELQALDAAGKLRVRVNAYLPANYLDDKFGIWFGAYRPHQTFSPNLRIGGVKLFADSALTNEMYLTEPHTDRPGDRGVVYWTPAELTDLVKTLHDDGWQVATHTCGDAAHDLVLDAYEAALTGTNALEHRHRIEHAMVLRDDQVKRLRDLRVLASFQLTWFTPDTTPDVRKTVGPDRLAWVGRWKDLLAGDVLSVASTDHPWDDLTDGHAIGGRAMAALAVAATRVPAPGIEPEAWQAAQRLSVDDGLGLLTAIGAFATFEEDRKGTITAGKLADLVVLSDDPRAVPVDRLADVSVAMTMVGGRVEFCAGGALCAALGS
jgi:predicted amidohydrolase YtcJ